jgi:hypothetical protein
VRTRPRSTSLVARAAVLGTLVLVALSGCGAAGGEPAAVTERDMGVVGAEGETSETEQSDSETADAMVIPRPGMLDAEPVEIWLEYGSWEGDLMYITFPSQGEPCEVLDRIEIDEAETRVTVTLYQGRDPDIAPDEPCDGPSRSHLVVLPPLERDYGPEEGAFVNGANPTDRP